MTTIKVKKLHQDAVTPTKREEDAAYDLYGIYGNDAIFMYPGDIYLAPLGIAVEFDKNYVFFITERSGSGSKGISTRAGVIDSGYRGEYKIPLNNTSNKLIILSNVTEEELKEKYQEKFKGFEENLIIYPQSKAIAQGLVIQLAPHCEIEEVDEMSSSQRSDGGFGSTGK
jgi:dUTP pyrophosphatase